MNFAELRANLISRGFEAAEAERWMRPMRGYGARVASARSVSERRATDRSAAWVDWFISECRPALDPSDPRGTIR